MTLLIIEEAYNGILQSGVVAIVLLAGCVLMYRHFSTEVKELKEELKVKNEEIKTLNSELLNITRENIQLQTRILDVLNRISK
jgi:hypothetical protein